MEPLVVNKEWQKVFDHIPEDCIIFGGAIRDLLDKNNTHKDFNNIDLFFSSVEEAKKFYNKIVDKASYRSNFFTKSDFIDSNINHSFFQVKIDSDSNSINNIHCYYTNDDTEPFLSDYNVNSLYGFVKDGKVNVIGSVAEGATLDAVIRNINNKQALTRFKEDTSEEVKIKRKAKIVSKQYNDIKSYANLKISSIKDIFYTISLAIHEYNKNAKQKENVEAHQISHQDKSEQVFKASNSSNTDSKEENKMSNSTKSSASQWFLANAEKGMYLGIAAATIKNLTDAIIAGMKAANVDETSLFLAKAFLESDTGKALLSSLVGAAAHFFPHDIVQNNKHVQNVADACLQNGVSKGSEALLNAAMSFVLPAIMSAVSSSPQVSMLETMNASNKVRVKDNSDANDDAKLEADVNAAQNVFELNSPKRAVKA